MTHGHAPRLIERHCDVAIIGGSAAGLTAALQLGRQRRSVIVVDAGQQPTPWGQLPTNQGRKCHHRTVPQTQQTALRPTTWTRKRFVDG